MKRKPNQELSRVDSAQPIVWSVQADPNADWPEWALKLSEDDCDVFGSVEDAVLAYAPAQLISVKEMSVEKLRSSGLVRALGYSYITLRSSTGTEIGRWSA